MLKNAILCMYQSFVRVGNGIYDKPFLIRKHVYIYLKGLILND